VKAGGSTGWTAGAIAYASAGALPAPGSMRVPARSCVKRAGRCVRMMSLNRRVAAT
jgi:hypothetical protein